MKRYLLLILIALFICFGFQLSDAATAKFIPATSHTGGGAGALDGINGASLNDLDVAIVVNNTDVYHYVLDDDSGLTESSPYIISPDTNAGSKRWILTGISGANGIYEVDASETDQGATGNTRTIKAFVDAIGTSKQAVIKCHHTGADNTTTYTLTTSETIPSNITLKIEPGAILDGAGTLTQNGPFETGLEQCFGSSITVTFGPGAVKEGVYPQWKGTKSDGVTDDITAIQAMADALPAGGKLVFIKGSSYYKINSTLDIDQQDNITLEFQNGAEIRLGASGTDGISVTKDYVTILNAIMEGEGTYVTSGSGGAILIKSTGNFTVVKDCYLKEPEQTGIKIEGDNAIVKYNTIEGGPYFADTAAIGADRQHYGIWFKGSVRSKCLYNEVIPNSEANAGVVIQGISTSSGDWLLLSSEVIGNTIKNCWDHGLYVYAERSIISNNDIYGCGTKIKMRPSGTSAGGNTVTNNVIRVGRRTGPLSGDAGLNFENLNGSMIQGNVVQQASDAGIYIYSADPFVVADNVISGNVVEDVADGNGTSALGLHVETVSTFANNVIKGNTFKTIGSDTDGVQAGIFLDLTDTNNHTGNVISGNTIEDSQENGILAYHLTASIISENTIYDIGKGAANAAIEVDDMNRCVIADNLIYGVGVQMSYGYREVNSDWNWVRDNYIYNSVISMIKAGDVGANTKDDNNWAGT